MTYSDAAREQNRDHTMETSVNWNTKTLFQRGGIDVVTGTQGGGPYRYVDVKQGVLVRKAFSANLEASLVRAGEFHATQQILTGTYRLNPAQTVGCRVVRQTGHDPTVDPGAQPPKGTNLFLSFSQHARSGSDYFLLIGDPNSVRSRGLITFKVLRPL